MNVRFRMVAFLLLGSLMAFAQRENSADLQEMEVAGWYRYTGSEALSAEAFLSRYHQALGLGPHDALVLKRSSQGSDGSLHLHYQQNHKGIPVEAGELVVHLRNGAVYLANGELISGLDKNTSSSLNEVNAFYKALSYFPADLYRWEAEGKGRPQGELIWVDKNFSKDPQPYRLAYKFDIFSLAPEDRNWVYIDAQNGELALALSRIHTGDTGTARTKYSGTHTIYTSFSNADSKYVLRDSLTGGGIYTFNMEKRTNKNSAVDFFDEDNYWANFNANFNEVGGDVHWGTERVYHFFKSFYNHQSYDNQNSPLFSYVHYDSNYVNAFWNGQEMTYGDGNGIASTPLTSLDVVAHEITHGVTEYTANLIYQGESGALNESFSDIFGVAIEFAYDSAGGDWKMGEDFLNTGAGLRNLRNPGLFNHPHTYFGNNWGQGLFFDNGYVHINSGVQNFWYYLLTDGDSGVNDLGDRYDIQGIGYQDAADIAFHNLNNYLTRFSDHQDARMGAMQSAIDLYGACSNEYIQTTNAWYAVGLGEPTGTIDLSLDGLDIPARGCNLGASENVIFAIRNNSCSNTIPAGASINLSFSVNNGPLQTMSLNLNAALLPDSSIYVAHNATADFSNLGMNDVFASISYSGDTLTYNNMVEQRVRNESYQNAEWKLVEVLSPVSSCALNDSTQVVVRAVFFGCDSLDPASSISLDYTQSGGSVQTLTMALPQTVHYGDTVELAFPSSLNLEARGRYTFNFTLQYPNDPTASNNRIFNYSVLKPYELLGGKIGFEDFSYSDSLIVVSGRNTGNRRNSVASVGSRGLEIVGGPLVNYGGSFDVPRSDTAVWQVNPSFRATFCTCVDASNEGSLDLHFDLKQAYTRLIRNLRSEPSNSEYTSSLRVLVNGTQVSPTYTPLTNNSDPFRTKVVNLDAYAGQYFELCFETHLLVDQRANNVTSDGDIVNLDNIYLSSSGIGLKEVEKTAIGFSLFPNPTNGQFNLDWTDAAEGDYRLWIQDAQGRIVYRRTISTQAGDQSWEFSTDLGAGVYFVQVQAPNGSVHSKQLLVD